ncbi:hypothetical protein GCM10007894_05950 [Paraferrimonas haliotis]|uniref:Uncharacterized protein n=1 Tax=Paraferrimonas haliotis TaxID=2013866 RepID=A0AA37TLG6_9GAMM|nr:hypothetical protein GCM10007894_05950 [Paraferrimonas haliotis]
MLMFVVVIQVFSALLFGNFAFNHAMPVSRWAFIGMIMGPFAWPMFQAHVRLNRMKQSSSSLTV